MKRLILCALTTLLTLPLAVWADRFDKQVPFAAGQRLELDIQTGANLVVRGSDADGAFVTVDRRGADAADAEVTVESVSGGARVRTSFPGKARSRSSYLQIEIRVPHRVTIDLRSMGGGVHLEGLEGTFHGSTNGGELDLSGLKGEVQLTTLGGDVHVVKSQLAGKVSTNGGNVVLDEVEGSLEGHSLGGTVRKVKRGKEGPGGASSQGPVVMSSMGGELDVDDAPEGTKLNTMGGNIHVRSAAKYVNAVTMGGDIVIDGVDGQVKATTMSGDISVTMTGDPARGDHRVKLVSNSGEVHLTVPPDLAMQIDIKLFYTRNSRRTYSVHSDFPVKTEESKEWLSTWGSPRKLIHATGSLGAGTYRIELTAINGDVYLTRAH